MKTFKKVEGKWIVPETTELFGLILTPDAVLEAPEDTPADESKSEE